MVWATHWIGPISWTCRSDIKIFFYCNAKMVWQSWKTVCKMGQTGHAEFIRLTLDIQCKRDFFYIAAKVNCLTVSFFLSKLKKHVDIYIYIHVLLCQFRFFLFFGWELFNETRFLVLWQQLLSLATVNLFRKYNKYWLFWLSWKLLIIYFMYLFCFICLDTMLLNIRAMYIVFLFVIHVVIASFSLMNNIKLSLQFLYIYILIGFKRITPTWNSIK